MDNNKFNSDKVFKELIRSKWIAAQVLGSGLDEYAELTTEEIMNLLEEVNKAEKEKMLGISNEFVDNGRANLLDRSFIAYHPATLSKAYVDYEMENSRTEPAMIMIRSQIHGSHMTLAQSRIEYTHKNYNGLKFVHIIWLLPGSDRFHIAKIHPKDPDDVYSQYAKFDITVIEIPKQYDPTLKNMHQRALSCLCCTKLGLHDKLSILKEEFHFKPENEEDIKNMFSFCDFIVNFSEKYTSMLISCKNAN